MREEVLNGVSYNSRLRKEDIKKHGNETEDDDTYQAGGLKVFSSADGP